VQVHALVNFGALKDSSTLRRLKWYAFLWIFLLKFGAFNIERFSVDSLSGSYLLDYLKGLQLLLMQKLDLRKCGRSKRSLICCVLIGKSHWRIKCKISFLASSQKFIVWIRRRHLRILWIVFLKVVLGYSLIIFEQLVAKVFKIFLFRQSYIFAAKWNRLYRLRNFFVTKRVGQMFLIVGLRFWWVSGIA
jgi:hypothetical protein